MHLKDLGKIIVGAGAVVVVAGQVAKLLPRLDADSIGEDRVVSRARESSGEIAPKLAATGKGDVALVWTAVRGGKGGDFGAHIGARVSRDRGATWGEIARFVSPDGRQSAEPGVAFFRGEATYTWLGFRRGPRGEAFDASVYSASDPTRVVRVNPASDPPGSSYAQLASASAGDRLYIAYRKVSGSASGVVLVATDDGVAFEAQSLSDGGETPAVCAQGERVVVAWLDPNSGVTVAASENRGKTFTRFVASAYREHLSREAPSCVVDGADVFLAYGAQDGAAAAVAGKVAPSDYVAVLRSHDGGKTTLDRSTVRPGTKMLHPTLALRSSGALDLAYLAGASEGDPRGHFGVARVSSTGQSRPARSLHAPTVFATDRADMAWGGDSVGLAATDQLSIGAVVDTVVESSDAGSGVERHIVIVPIAEE